MSYIKPKVRLSEARDKDSLLKLRCDCGVSFVSHVIVEGVNKEGEKKLDWLKHWPPKLGIWEWSLGCVA